MVFLGNLKPAMQDNDGSYRTCMADVTSTSEMCVGLVLVLSMRFAETFLTTIVQPHLVVFFVEFHIGS